MRWLVVVTLVSCTDPSGPSGTNAGPLTPELCTAGTPGDATCPLTTADLGVSGSKATFAVTADTSNPNLFYILSPKLQAGSTGLYISHPRFEAWPDGASSPTANPSDPNATTNINLVASGTTILTPTMVSASRMTLAWDAIGPHR